MQDGGKYASGFGTKPPGGLCAVLPLCPHACAHHDKALHSVIYAVCDVSVIHRVKMYSAHTVSDKVGYLVDSIGDACITQSHRVITVAVEHLTEFLRQLNSAKAYHALYLPPVSHRHYAGFYRHVYAGNERFLIEAVEVFIVKEKLCYQVACALVYLVSQMLYVISCRCALGVDFGIAGCYYVEVVVFPDKCYQVCYYYTMNK